MGAIGLPRTSKDLNFLSFLPSSLHYPKILTKTLILFIFKYPRTPKEFPKDSQRIPIEFQKKSNRIAKEFQKNSKRIPKEFQKNSKRSPKEVQKKSKRSPKNSPKIP